MYVIYFGTVDVDGAFRMSRMHLNNSIMGIPLVFEVRNRGPIENALIWASIEVSEETICVAVVWLVNKLRSRS